jgi:SAM-dependent methyltransferase
MRKLVMDWMKEAVDRYRPEPPVLEVGAYNENGTVRSLFPQPGYLGIDVRPGPGVDLVADILGPAQFASYGTVYACETLEHVLEPWVAIERMFAALRPGGLFLATWCFSFPIHAAPRDFYRVTPYGFHYLLSRAGFVEIVVDTAGTNRPAGRPPAEEDWQWPDMVAAAARRPL